MRHFTISTDVDAPAERVWHVMTDTARWHEWTPSITSIKQLGPAPLAPGGRALIKQPKFPPAVWTVTSVVPGRSFSWVSVGPGFRAVGTHSVEANGSGSRATLSLDLEGPLGGVWGRLTRGITERYIGFEAKGLKLRSENPGFRHSGA